MEIWKRTYFLPGLLGERVKYFSLSVRDAKPEIPNLYTLDSVLEDSFSIDNFCGVVWTGS